MGTIVNTTKGNIFWFTPDDPRLKVITDKSHKLYDKRVELPLDTPELQGMISTISDPDIGILEPVIARKVGDFWEVTEGRQRVRCAREAFRRGAKHVKIPVIVKTHRDFEVAKIASICNVQRVEDPPHVKGFNAQRLLDSGASWEELESVFAAKKSTIQSWIRVHEAPEEVHRAVENGEITSTQAVSVAKKATRGGAEAARKALKTAKAEGGPKTRGRKPGPQKRTVTFVATEVEPGRWDVKCKKKVSHEDAVRIGDAFDVMFTPVDEAGERYSFEE